MVGFEIIKKFPSKKNNVFLVKDNYKKYVIKFYNPQFRERASSEYLILKKIYSLGIPVPEPIDLYENKALIMEYLPGKNFCDIFNASLTKEYALHLSKWYANLHLATACSRNKCIIKGDSILKNFLLVDKSGTNQILYGIDFEESSVGEPAMDIGQICASILDTNPMFTPQKACLSKILINKYLEITGYNNGKKIVRFIVKSLKMTSRWRPKQKEYLLSKAELIEKKGLEGLIEK